MITAVCIKSDCDKVFHRKRLGRGYCSKKCSAVSPGRRRLKRVARTCQWKECGKWFEWDGKRGHGQFCGMSCYNAHRRANVQHATGVCVRPGCENTYKRKAHQRGRGYCSKKCSQVSEQRKGANRLKIGQWSRHHDECVACGRIDSPYGSRGRCSRCFQRENRRRRKGIEDSCEICDETRSLTGAHLVPRRHNGPWEDFNILTLCPSHHHFFDNDWLTILEWRLIESAVQLAYTRLKRRLRVRVFKGRVFLER